MKKNSIKSFFAAAGPASKKQKVGPSVLADAHTVAGETSSPPATTDSTTADSAAPAAISNALNNDSKASDSSANGLFASLNEEWVDGLCVELKKPYIKTLEQFVDREYSSRTVFPPRADVFAALNSCPLSDVKVVILGQDPYHGPGQKGIPPPPSLKNIYKEMKSDVGVKIPSHGYLKQWSEQGGWRAALCFAHLAWETFTDAIIRKVGQQEGIVFLLWGKPAHAKCEFIDRTKHRVITTSHPSPLGATKTNQPFIGSRCFSKCNEHLTELGKDPIDWQLSF